MANIPGDTSQPGCAFPFSSSYISPLFVLDFPQFSFRDWLMMDFSAPLGGAVPAPTASSTSQFGANEPSSLQQQQQVSAVSAAASASSQSNTTERLSQQQQQPPSEMGPHRAVAIKRHPSVFDHRCSVQPKVVGFITASLALRASAVAESVRRCDGEAILSCC
jgi:hypothetical protein